MTGWCIIFLEKNYMDAKDVYQIEINQLHNAICDFSHQSISIKKVSITIYVAFLSMFFAFNNGESTMPKQIVFLIGFIIPVFFYVYEIYIDYTRQTLRARMNNIFIELEKAIGITPRADKSVRATLFGLDIDRKSNFRFVFESHRNADKKKYYYINLVHSMYLIYILEAIVTIVIGILM